MTGHQFEPSAAIRVQLASTVTSWRTLDGAPLTIRPTRPSDAGIMQQFVRALSPEARYCRFMGAVRELTPQMLERFVRIDQLNQVALVAVTSRDGRTFQLGECRYAVCPGSDDCEFAVAVLDEWQRRGLGERLLSELIAVARNRGLRAMSGEVLASNAAMLGLALKFGFNVSPSSQGWSVRHVSLALRPTPAPLHSSTRHCRAG